MKGMGPTLLSIITRLIVIRFRLIPPFGQTIRRFSNNVSEMKKLAAQDYEDLLQVNAIRFLDRTPDVLTATTSHSVLSRRLKVSLMSLITSAL
jgi:hypothetical protein